MRILAVLAFFGFLASSDPALAFQTEADPQELHHKRTATIRDYRQEAREARMVTRDRARRNAEPEVGLAPDPVGISSAGSPIAAYARAAGFPEEVIPTMVQIALRESGGDPSAVNPSSGACGLWQLYPCPGPEALDPWVNARLAFEKYRAAGLSPWS